jgi:hypothetical protein
MKRRRARTNAEIVAEIFNRRPIGADASPERREWLMKITDIMRRNLLAKLERGGADRDDQKNAARLLRALTERHRGRPRCLSTPSERQSFADTLDWFVAVHQRQGKAEPLQAALRDAQSLERDEGHAPSLETLKKYYRDGVRDMKQRDLRFAAEIDAEVNKTGLSLDEVFAAHGTYDANRPFYERRRYSRVLQLREKK